MSDNELLRRYLLGELPEDEERSVEERLLRDDELAELAEAIESEILEDYARGELSPAQRRRVDGFLASSPSGRLTLAVVQGLGTLAAETRPDNVRPFVRPDLSRPMHRFAAIAALLAVAAASVVLVRIQPDLPDRIVAVPPAVETPVPIVPPGEHTPPETEPGPVEIAETPAPVPSPSLPAVVIQLALSTQRDPGQGTDPFDVAPGQAAELHIPLGAPEQGYRSYQVLLKVGQNEEVFQVQSGTGEGKRLLVVPIPAGKLREGLYSVTVQGVDADGVLEDLVYQEFRVRQP